METGRQFIFLIDEWDCVMRERQEAEELQRHYHDRTADAAIQQIKDRKYTQALEGYIGEILLVGINYGRENRDKPHSCVIERIEKEK